MGEEGDVHVLEKALAHEIRLGPDQLLRGARPDADRAGQLLALHQLLHGDGRGDIHRLSRVVTFAVPGRPLDEGCVIRDPRLLRGLRDAVDVGSERQHRLAATPGRHERRRDARDPFLHGEAVLAQDVDEVAVRLDLLEAQLAVAEDLIDHLLRERRHRVDAFARFALQPFDPRVGWGRRRGTVLRQRRGGSCGGEQRDGDPSRNRHRVLRRKGRE
jgi:hypothetical protein